MCSRSDYLASIRLVLEGMLQSPQFLYRTEMGALPTAAVGSRTLTSHEIAAQLPYLFPGSPPDAALQAAADSGALMTPEGRESQLRRLVQNILANEPRRMFFEQWMLTTRVYDVIKAPAVYPAFDEGERENIHAAMKDFGNSVFVSGNGSLTTLLAGPSSVLLQPFLLATHSHPGESFPIARGKFVRERLLCQPLPASTSLYQPLPAPPASLNVMPVPANPALTTRERFSAHSTDPACAGCHSLIDPIGFGFEQYDGMGVFRTMENGKPVDDAGELTGTSDANGPFRGPAELGARLAASSDVRACAVKQAFRYTFGRGETAADVEKFAPIMEHFMAFNQDIREIFVAFVKSEMFVRR